MAGNGWNCQIWIENAVLCWKYVEIGWKLKMTRDWMEIVLMAGNDCK